MGDCMSEQPFDLMGFIKNGKEEKTRLEAELAGMGASFGDKAELVKKAFNGGIVLDGEVLTSLANNIISLDNSTVIGLLQGINEKAREAMYAYYATADEGTIEQDRVECLAMYLQLKDEGAKAKEHFEATGWNHDLFNNYFETIIVQNYGTNKNIVGVKEMTRMDGVAFDPTSFDILYDICKKTLTTEGKPQNKRVFGEAERSVIGRIASLKAMTPEQYKNFKIAQMCLTEDEKTLFNKHIQEFGKAEAKGVEL